MLRSDAGPRRDAGPIRPRTQATRRLGLQNREAVRSRCAFIGSDDGRGSAQKSESFICAGPGPRYGGASGPPAAGLSGADSAAHWFHAGGRSIGFGFRVYLLCKYSVAALPVFQ